jgi:hypothetical protein
VDKPRTRLVPMRKVAVFVGHSRDPNALVRLLVTLVNIQCTRCNTMLTHTDNIDTQ